MEFFLEHGVMYRLCSINDRNQSNTFREWVMAKNNQKCSEKSEENTPAEKEKSVMLRKEMNAKHYRKWLGHKLKIEDELHQQRENAAKKTKTAQKKRKAEARRHYKRWKRRDNKHRRESKEKKKKDDVEQSLNVVLKNVSGRISFEKWLKSFSKNHPQITERKDRRPRWRYEIEDAESVSAVSEYTQIERDHKPRKSRRRLRL